MARHEPGERAVAYLIERGRLEAVVADDLVEAAAALLGRARRRLLTAAAGLDAGDVDGAFAASYDAYRMAAEALLLCQGLRATGGDGSHVTVEDAIAAQFSERITQYGKATFERLRRTRHAAQYFDPSSPPIEEADARWALDTSSRAVDAVVAVLATDPPDRRLR